MPNVTTMNDEELQQEIDVTRRSLQEALLERAKVNGEVERLSRYYNDLRTERKGRVY